MARADVVRAVVVGAAGQAAGIHYRRNMTPTLPPVSLRAAEDTDTTQMLDLNNDAVPAVNELDADSLAALVAGSHRTVVVTSDTADILENDILGFAVIYAAGADYASENYRWFSAREQSFLYVDRIVVGPAHRDVGIGALLYSAVFDAAREQGAEVVYCEVNLQPPNPRSLDFHTRLGFEEIGQQSTKNDTVVVSLLSATVAEVRSAPPA